MSLLSLWLQNKQCIERHLSDDTLIENFDQIISAFGGIKSLLMICLQHKYTMTYQQHFALWPILKHIGRSQQKTNQKDADIDHESLQFVSLNNAFLLRLCSFLDENDLNQFRSTNHCIQTSVMEYQCLTRKNNVNKPFEFGSCFSVLFNKANDDDVFSEMDFILKKMNKFGQKYALQLCKSNVISQIVLIGMETLTFDIHCILIKICRKILNIDSKNGHYLRKHANAFVDSFNFSFLSVSDVNLDANRNNLILILIELIKHRYYKPSTNEMIKICQNMNKIIDGNIKNKPFDYLYQISLCVQLILLTLKTNENGVDCKQTVRCMIDVLQKTLNEYINFYNFEWIHHVKDDQVQNMRFVLHSKKEFHQFSSRKQLISHYNPIKYVAFGIMDQASGRILSFLKDYIAQIPLFIAEVFNILSMYQRIDLNADLIASILKTLNIDGFRWSKDGNKPTNDYELRRGFMMNMIKCDENILYNPTITEYLSSLKPLDIDCIFMNIANNYRLIKHFFSLMTDINAFIQHCDLSKYGQQGIDALIELIKTEYAHIGVYKLCQIIDSAKEKKIILPMVQHILSQIERFEKFDENIFAILRLLNKLNILSKRESVSHLTQTLLQRINMQHFEKDTDKKKVFVMDAMQIMLILQEVILLNPTLIHFVRLNPAIMQFIINILDKNPSLIPLNLLLLLSNIIVQNQISNKPTPHIWERCKDQKFILLWIASINKQQNMLKMTVNARDCELLLTATKHILTEYKQSVKGSKESIQTQCIKIFWTFLSKMPLNPIVKELRNILFSSPISSSQSIPEIDWKLYA